MSNDNPIPELYYPAFPPEHKCEFQAKWTIYYITIAECRDFSRTILSNLISNEHPDVDEFRDFVTHLETAVSRDLMSFDLALDDLRQHGVDDEGLWAGDRRAIYELEQLNVRFGRLESILRLAAEGGGNTDFKPSMVRRERRERIDDRGDGILRRLVARLMKAHARRQAQGAAGNGQEMTQAGNGQEMMQAGNGQEMTQVFNNGRVGLGNDQYNNMQGQYNNMQGQHSDIQGQYNNMEGQHSNIQGPDGQPGAPHNAHADGQSYQDQRAPALRRLAPAPPAVDERERKNPSEYFQPGNKQERRS